jgi:hypothetical protein
MAQTVRIDPTTHALLQRLAEADGGVSLQEELSRAVQSRRRELFFAELHAGYARLSKAERAEGAADTALWDAALGDGLEPEDR